MASPWMRLRVRATVKPASAYHLSLLYNARMYQVLIAQMNLKVSIKSISDDSVLILGAGRQSSKHVPLSSSIGPRGEPQRKGAQQFR